MGAKATLQKLDSIHAAIYTTKASNAAVYTAKTSPMLTNRSLSMSVFLTFIILQDIIPECIVSCCVGILLSLAIHYSWVCSDLAHIKKEDKQGHEELKPNFIYFLADFFFDSSYCCIHFSCRQVHCPFISVSFNSLNGGIHFSLCQPFVAGYSQCWCMYRQRLCVMNFDPIFFLVCVYLPFINPSIQHVLNFLIK